MERFLFLFHGQTKAQRKAGYPFHDQSKAHRKHDAFHLGKEKKKQEIGESENMQILGENCNRAEKSEPFGFLLGGKVYLRGLVNLVEQLLQ